MWQSLPFKISQPEQATCHNPPLTKLTSQILPRHHLLHLTHETLTLIFLLSFHHHGSRHPSRQSRHQPPRFHAPVTAATINTTAPLRSRCSNATIFNLLHHLVGKQQRRHSIISAPARFHTTVTATIASHLLSARKPWQQRRCSCTSSRSTITTKHPPFAQLPSSPQRILHASRSTTPETTLTNLHQIKEDESLPRTRTAPRPFMHLASSVRATTAASSFA